MAYLTLRVLAFTSAVEGRSAFAPEGHWGAGTTAGNWLCSKVGAGSQEEGAAWRTRVHVRVGAIA